MILMSNHYIVLFDIISISLRHDKSYAVWTEKIRKFKVPWYGYKGSSSCFNWFESHNRTLPFLIYWV